MHHGADDIDEPDDPLRIQQAELAREAVSPPGSSVIAFLSTIGTATLVSVLLGLFYYYTHHYRGAYLGRLGFDPEALPITTQEAIVEGFDGIVTTILWKLALVTLFIPVYLAAVWGIGVLLERLAERLGISRERRSMHPVLAALRRSLSFKASLILAAIAIGTTILSSLTVLLIGGPALHAGQKEADDLLKRVRSTAKACARYDMKDGSGIIGWRIGSTADRQFVLGNDQVAYVIKFDDLKQLHEKAVACHPAGAVVLSKTSKRDNARFSQAPHTS